MTDLFLIITDLFYLHFLCKTDIVSTKANSMSNFDVLIVIIMCELSIYDWFCLYWLTLCMAFNRTRLVCYSNTSTERHDCLG